MCKGNERYLGDGVYASFDGYQIWLRTAAQEKVHEIALEPEVFVALIDYAAMINKEKIDGLGYTDPPS